ncbi:MAG TPA: ABC transporter substrate-binding protein [Chloroflexota bacterium]|nr:ABC transporter substrate-binding protein [Chloroflexota bacterium]
MTAPNQPRRASRRLSLARAGAATAVALLLVACGPQAAPAPAPAAAPPAGSAAAPPAAMKLTAAYGSISATQLPLWVTKEQGYFTKYGLDVDLSYIDGSAGVRALASGDAPVSAVGGALVPSRLSGADVVAIAEMAPRLVYGVYVAPDITAVDGLRGRTIVTTTPGSTNYQGVTLFLRRYGMEPGRDVNLLTSAGGTEQLAMLKQGLADAALFSPPSSIRAREQGLHQLLNLAETNITFLTSTIGVNQPFAAKNPEIIRAFLKAYAEGLRDTTADPVQAKAALAKYASLDDPAAVDESYNFTAPTWPKGAPYPVVAAIQTILDLQDSAEARAAHAEDFVDARYVRELDEAGFFRQIGLTE